MMVRYCGRSFCSANLIIECYIQRLLVEISVAVAAFSTKNVRMNKHLKNGN